MTEITANQLLEELHKDVTSAKRVQIQAWRNNLSAVETPQSTEAQYTPPTIQNAVETLVDNRSANAYLFSILLSCCIKKLVDPAQDIRIGQENMPGGYSNRSFDARHVTPFLKRHGYTHSETSGLESGRNFERPLPWNLKYPAKPRGKGNREAFLGILDYLETLGGDPKTVASYLLYYDQSRSTKATKTAAAPKEERIETIMRIFENHFRANTGQGKSRLPVLALYAIYEMLVKQIERYAGMRLLPLQRHTTADLRSGAVGDIQVNEGDRPFEGVEVKSEKTLTAAMIRELPRKLRGKAVSRYYVLSTLEQYILRDDEEAVRRAVQEVETETGTQIIVNSLTRTLWYYARLVSDPTTLLQGYQALLDSDRDIRKEQRDAWNVVLTAEYSKKDES